MTSSTRAHHEHCGVLHAPEGEPFNSGERIEVTRRINAEWVIETCEVVETPPGSFVVRVLDTRPYDRGEDPSGHSWRRAR